MPERKPRLSDFSRNVYSQFGEDGILAKIFEIIEPRSKTCVEFGAWEGYLHSNTANLWTKGWRGVLIEGDRDKYERLVVNTEKYGCLCIHAFIKPTGQDSIDSILEHQNIIDVDLMSIDIDGNDYYIFESITKILPRVIICEFNPTIPKHLEIVQIQDAFFGCSSLALVNLARRKGYELVAMSDANCIFVRRDEYPAFSLFETAYDAIAPENSLTWLITSFDGSYLLSREPTFGFNKPFTGKLAIGELRYIKPDSVLVKAFKKIGRSQLAANLKTIWRVANWYIAGQKSPPPEYIKRRILIAIAERYSLKNLVEIGTQPNQSTLSLKDKFKKILLVEEFDGLYNRAIKAFHKEGHIYVHFGKNAEVLPQVIADLKEPTLFWLDAQHSGRITETEANETPIMKKLETIFSHNIQGHVILIDDARCFIEKNDYPTLDELKSNIDRLEPNAVVEIKNDMILITKR